MVLVRYGKYSYAYSLLSGEFKANIFAVGSALLTVYSLFIDRKFNGFDSLGRLKSGFRRLASDSEGEPLVSSHSPS